MLNSTMPGEFRGSWAFVLEPTDDGRTKLDRAPPRSGSTGPQPVGAELAMEAMGFGVFLMMRRQMLGIRGRAERVGAVEDAGARVASDRRRRPLPAVAPRVRSGTATEPSGGRPLA